MLWALSVGLGTLALGLHGVAAFRRDRVLKKVCIAISLSICLGMVTLWLEGRPPSSTPKPSTLFDGLFLCFSSLNIFGSEVNVMFRDRVPGVYGKVWRAILLLVGMSLIASLLNPSVLSWIYPAVLGTIPLFRAIRRRSLGDVMFEFPRIHGELWKSTGLGILIAASALLVISIGRGSISESMLNFAIVIAAHSLRRNAGRSNVRAAGIESHARLIGWADLRGYEWFEQSGINWLRLKNEEQDLWIAAKPVAEVNAAFTRVGLPAIA